MSDNNNESADNKTKKKHEIHGKCGAGILLFTNGLLLSIGLLTIIYGVLVLFKAFAKANTPKLAASFPDFLIYGLIGFGVCIVFFSGLGLFGTICMRKAADKMFTYEDEHSEDDNKKKHDAPCCATCTLAIYIILCFVAFLFLLAAGSVAASFQYQILTTELKSTGATDVAMKEYNNLITTQVEKMSANNTDEWIKAMDAGKCCGWRSEEKIIANTVNVTAKCCKLTNASKAAVEDAKCSVNANATAPSYVDTCDGYISSLVADNLVVIMASCYAFAFICLICFVCAIVVRCAIHKEHKRIKRNNVAPENE